MTEKDLHRCSGSTRCASAPPGVARVLRVGLLAVSAVLALAAAAPAAVTPLARAPHAAATAVGGERVLVATQHGGRARLLALPASGGAPDPVLRRAVDALDGFTWTGLAAQGERVAVALQTQDLAARGVPVTTHVLRSLAGSTLASVLTRPENDPAGDPYDPVFDGDLLLVPGDIDLGVRSLVAFPDAGDPFSVSLPVGGVPVAAAGGRVAVLAPAAGGTAEDDFSRVVVIDTRTGTEIRSLPVEDNVTTADVALRADGAVAWTDLAGGHDRLHVALPGEPQKVVLRARANVVLMRPVFAGERVAVIRTELQGRDIAVVPAAGGSADRLGPLAWDVDRLSSDGQRLAWTADGCVVTALATDGPVAALPPGPCPRTLAHIRYGDQVAVGAAPRRISVPVVCRAAPGAGCRGVLQLRRRGRLVGRAGFAGIPAGDDARVAVPLTAGGAAAVRRGLRDGYDTLQTRVTGVDPQGHRSVGACGCLQLVRHRTG